MVLKCCVMNCRMRAGRDIGIKFFRFPVVPKTRMKLVKLAEERQQKWLKALSRKDLKLSSLKYATVCSKHFLSGRSANIKDVLNPDWVPSLELGYETTTAPTKYSRSIRRAQLKELLQNPTNSEPEIEMIENINNSPTNMLQEEPFQTDPLCDDKSCQTDAFYFESVMEAHVNNLEQKIKSLSEKVKALEEENLVTRTQTTMGDLKHCPLMTKYLTGFDDYDTLETVFKHVEHDLPANFKENISRFEIFLIALIKLRIDIPFTYLSFYYRVSIKTISALFQKAIVAIHDKLSCFIFWPDKEASLANIPGIFKDIFGIKPVFIIDCFEIYSEKPDNFLVRSNRFSNYKQHQTVKYLVCISSFRSIAFISKGYVGQCSDKFIFDNCGILNLLAEGDIVLADSGFLIEEAKKKKRSRLIMPSFKNTKSQLEPISVESNSQISTVRMHVERIIEILWQKFAVKANRQPIMAVSENINENMYFDYMVEISGAVFNLSPSILETHE